MADTVFGSKNNPAPANPFDQLVEFHGGRGNYKILRLRVWRRFLGEASYAHLTGGDEGLSAYAAAHPEGDHIRQTLLSYTLHVAWPVNDGTHTFPVSPPYDVDPNKALAVAGMLDGMPNLGGPGGLAAGEICTFRAGDFGGTPSQTTYYPGGRFKPASGISPNLDGKKLPDPPQFGGRTGNWGSPIATFQIYTTLENAAGDVLASKVLDFSGVRQTIGNTAEDKIFRCVASAVVPREEGAFQHNPPFTGGAAGLNGNNHGDIWLLLKLTDG